MNEETERGDVLALLERRIANHGTVAAKQNGSEERARWLQRECEIIRDTIAAGLHEGKAGVEGDLSGRDPQP